MTRRLIDLIVTRDFNNGLSRRGAVLEPRPHVRQLDGTPSTYVFSSTNTAATVALYGDFAVIECALTARRGPRILSWTFVALLAAVIGFSRTERGEYGATEVVFGALLRIASLWSAVSIIRVVRANPGVRRSTPNLELGQVATPAEGARP